MDRKLITQKEDELFIQWKEALKEEKGFISDGVVDPNGFADIVFIMKEVHSENDIWNLREKVLSTAPNLWRTWNNVARWTAGLNSDFRISWKEIDHLKISERHVFLRLIASMNVKKIAGKTTSNMNAIHKYAENDKDFLKKQLSLYLDNYKIKYVLCCCGKYERFTFLDEIFPMEDLVTSNDVKYRVKDDTVLIFYSHPNPRFVKKKFLYENLSKAVLEIKEKRSNQ